MRIRVTRTTIIELSEDEALDLAEALKGFTAEGTDLSIPLPTDRQVKVAALFATELEASLG